MPVKRHLQELNVKHKLAYPSALIFTREEQIKTIKDGKESDDLIQSTE